MRAQHRYLDDFCGKTIALQAYGRDPRDHPVHRGPQPDAGRVVGRLRVSGPDPEHRSYRSFASFSDPDGNGWLLQEVTTRLPGREWED